MWDYFTRACRTFRSPGPAERDLPRNPSQGGGLSTRSPTLNFSQNADTGDHRLPKVPPDNGLSDDPSSVCIVDIVFMYSDDLYTI